MKQHSTYLNHTLLLLALLLVMAGCKKKEYVLPITKDVLQNDAIKRTIGPNIVGQSIEFAYAMAIKPEKGKLVSAQVEASIEGAAGTYMENRTFFTNGSGNDVGTQIGDPSVTNKQVTAVTFTKDTNTSTLRYYYVIPEEARGKTVSFTFSAKSSNGESVSYKLGPYTIAKMSMKRSITVSDGNVAYISLADMTAYNAADAATNAAKIDLVYLYRNITTKAFNHALVAPAAPADYLPGVTLPAGVNRDAKLRKVFNLQDYNLALLQYGIYIDDLDFQQLNVKDEPNYTVNLKAEAGVWVETGDGKYRAYVFVNSVNNTTKSAVISIKLYAL